MFNRNNGFKIAVMAPVGGSPVIMVPSIQADEVHRLLAKKGIGHTVESLFDPLKDPSVVRVIHVGKHWDREEVQDVLDSVQ